MNKHSPGPWKFSPFQDCSPIPIFDAEMRRIAVTYADQREGVDPIANARLIVHSPEMKALLVEFHRLLPNCYGPFGQGDPLMDLWYRVQALMAEIHGVAPATTDEL